MVARRSACRAISPCRCRKVSATYTVSTSGASLFLMRSSAWATDAVAASVYYHLTLWVAVTLVGLFCLQRTGLRLRQLERVAEETEEEAERELPAG